MLRPILGLTRLCLVIVAVAFVEAADAPDLVRVLHDWEVAAASVEPSLAATDLAEYDRTHSAHELEAASQLLGAVSARTLIQEFAWTVEANENGNVVLIGAPRDPLVQAFFSSIEIEIDKATHRPRLLQFYDANRRQRPEPISVPLTRVAAAPELLPANASEIQLIAFVELEDDSTAGADSPLATELAKWAEATRQITRAEIEFVRYQYDHVSRMEKQGEGRFHFEAPNSGVYEVEASDVAANTKSRRSAPDGTPYSVEADRASICLWDHRQVVVADPEQKRYDRFAAPKASIVQPAGSFQRLWYSLETPQRAFPATVDVHSGFLERFDWSELSRDENHLILQGRPITDEDQLEVSEFEVVLDRATHLPQATRRVAGDGQTEVVHVLKWTALNDAVPESEWRPDLSSYAESDPAPLAPPAEEAVE